MANRRRKEAARGASMICTIPKTLEDAFAHHTDHVDSEDQLATIAGLDVKVVQGFPNDRVSDTALMAYRTKLEANIELRIGRVTGSQS
jgi:hypothetical protein